MEAQMKRSILQGVLQTAHTVVGSRPLMPILRCCLLGKGRLVAGNGIVQFDARLRSKDKAVKEIVLAVPVRIFYDFISSISDPRVALSQMKEGEATVLRVVAKGVDCKLVAEPADDFPLRKIPSSVTWAVLPKDFARGIGLCMSTACADDTGGAMKGVRVAGKYLESTDRFRISKFHMEAAVGKVPFVLPPEACQALTSGKAHYEEIGVEAGGKMVHFKTKYGDYLSSTTLFGKFPDTNAVLSAMVDKAVVVLPDTKAMAPVMSRQMALQRDLRAVDQITELRFSKAVLEVSCKTHCGMVKDELPIKSTLTKPATYCVTTSFLAAALEHCSKVCFDPDNEGERKVLFQGEGYEHLVMTRALSGPAAGVRRPVKKKTKKTKKV